MKDGMKAGMEGARNMQQYVMHERCKVMYIIYWSALSSVQGSGLSLYLRCGFKVRYI